MKLKPTLSCGILGRIGRGIRIGLFGVSAVSPIGALSIFVDGFGNGKGDLAHTGRLRVPINAVAVFGHMDIGGMVDGDLDGARRGVLDLIGAGNLLGKHDGAVNLDLEPGGGALSERNGHLGLDRLCGLGVGSRAFAV